MVSAVVEVCCLCRQNTVSAQMITITSLIAALSEVAALFGKYVIRHYTIFVQFK